MILVEVFIYHQECISGIASTDQPTNDTKPTIESWSSLSAPCTCPRRQIPPSPPTSLPFPATEENREKLEQFLRDYYRSSTFNTCEHQPLLMMQGPPLRLMVDTKAKPVAYHTPIPVPLHWTEDVKAGLDQDVCLRRPESRVEQSTSSP